MSGEYHAESPSFCIKPCYESNKKVKKLKTAGEESMTKEEYGKMKQELEA